jgi:S1-C subfamily serine protease
MKKWITPLLIVVLFVGIVANGFLYIRQATIVQNDEALIASLQTDVVSTKDGITSLSGNIQTLTGNMSDLSGSVSNLRTDVQTLTGNMSSLSGLVDNLQQTWNNTGSGSIVDFTSATDKIKPSVVVIEVQIVTTVFPGRRVTQQAAGSGWIINGDGLIITNNHVVADATSIRVTLADGRAFPSVAVQTDAATDLAVVKIDAHNLPAVKIGDSDRLQVGQPVAAIGNALGLGINMTGGWVSRLNTSITFGDGSSLSGLIGTDAAINPGNSGGPLININGEVIGITNAKLVETGVEGIGYAISINNAIRTINSLIGKL